MSRRMFTYKFRREEWRRKDKINNDGRLLTAKVVRHMEATIRSMGGKDVFVIIAKGDQENGTAPPLQ